MHEVQADHHGYTFPYDDVKPSIMVDADEVSGSMATEGVRVLRVIVGGTQQANSAPPSSPESSDATAQSYSAQDTSAQNTESSTAPSDTSNGGDAPTYASKSSNTPDTSTTASTSDAPASLESLTSQPPTTMITLPSSTNAPAHPGDSPIAYSSQAGETTQRVPIVTIIETAVVTTYVTTTTTVLN